MDTSFYLAFSGMRADMRSVEVVANNLANLQTNGFREERPFIEALESAGGSYAQVGGTRRRSLPGAMVATGRDLDVAIEGEGYLVVDTPAGRRYTRDGGLSLDEDGTVRTREGYPVQGQGGSITLRKGTIEIDADGRLQVAGVQAGRLLVVDVPAEKLVREGNGLYRLDSGEEARATEASLRQGFLEASNVQLPAVELDQLQRHFQALSRALQMVNGLERQLITTARGQ